MAASTSLAPRVPARSSLLESGHPLVRGVELGFPALLQPLLTVPSAPSAGTV